MKTVTEMAREAGFEGDSELTWEGVICTEELERFAELARADERARLLAGVEMPEYGINTANHAGLRVVGYTADQLRETVAAAVAREREACAKVCEELLERPSGYQGTWEGYGKFKTQMTGQECAAAIQARGTHDH